MLDLKKVNYKVEKAEIAGDEVFIRHLTMKEIETIATMKNAMDIPKKLIKICLCDEDGKLLNYSDSDLDNQPASLIKQLAEKIMQVNDLAEKKS